MRVLYLDCFSGISGDMAVGALCDLGVKPSAFEWALSQLNLPEAMHLHFEKQARSGIAGVKFGVHGGATHAECGGPVDASGHSHAPGDSDGHTHGEGGHAHGHGHGSHAHERTRGGGGGGHAGHAHGRSYADIRGMLERSGLEAPVKSRALAVFRRIAEAEGKVHGIAAEAVHFHEVGALDSIVDVVCACAGVFALGVDAVWASAPREGRGFIECAHGRMPVPSPATLELLRGIPMEQTDEPHELITPTGAALLAEYVTRFGTWSGIRVERVGHGLGTRELKSRPNVLRAAVGEASGMAGGDGGTPDRVAVIETNLDDASPEVVADAIARLMAAGALDVAAAPATMKKNRPGLILTVMARTGDAARVAEMVLRHTTAFGVRLREEDRLVLDREMVEVETRYGRVAVKVGRMRGEIVRAAPEFESCRRVAEVAGVPVREVFDAAGRAFGERV